MSHPGAQRSSIFTSQTWQMSLGERAALSGILGGLGDYSSPIEIGVGAGGSLETIAAHSDEVHAFDVTISADVSCGLGNTTFHVGNSHVLLPRYLDALAVASRNVDFALVDGDHTSHGVRQDLEDLLRSTSVATR